MGGAIAWAALSVRMGFMPASGGAAGLPVIDVGSPVGAGPASARAAAAGPIQAA
jgi:hypothetical protein